MIRAVTLLAVLLAAVTPARADVWTDLAAGQRAIAQLEGGRAQLAARRTTVEQHSQALAGEIERLKDAPPGVRRDLRLQELLAAQKSDSDELERIGSELRGRASTVAGARRKLIADCDRALAGALPEAQRVELARLRATQAALLATPGRPLGVARAEPDPLDGPRELQDKADLLRDSRDKLRREAERLAQRIDSVERRRHLRERAGAIDEDLFGEAVANRRSTSSAQRGGSGSSNANAGGATAPTAGGPAGGTGAPAAPGGGGNPPPATASGGQGDSGGGPALPTHPASAGDSVTLLRDLVDPATLDELRRSDGGDDPDRQVRALRRAQGELDNLARELDRRAHELSTRADELKHRK